MTGGDMKGIRAVIFDFNGVLVDDESVHFALFCEMLAQEDVVITERDYHERYLGYDDRKCFESALLDAGQNASRERLDQMIEQKARRYIEVANQGLRYFPAAARTLNLTAAKWPVAICSVRCDRKSSMHSSICAAATKLLPLSRPRILRSASPTLRATF